MEVITDSGTQQGLAYVATKVDDALVPYAWYKSLVLAGALEHGLPTAYIDGIRAVRACVGPKPQRRTRREAEEALEGTDLSSH